jgi:hypothetical protein
LINYLKSKNLEIPTKSIASHIFFNAIFDSLSEESITKNSFLIKKFFEILEFSDEKK